MKKAIWGIALAGILALQSGEAKTISSQLTPTYKNIASSDTLYDKVKDFPKSEIQSQYLLKENNLFSYAREFIINEKPFIEYYMVIPQAVRLPNGIAFPIAEKPYWYFYDGKHYEDRKMDGLNGNEVGKGQTEM